MKMSSTHQRLSALGHLTKSFRVCCSLIIFLVLSVTVVKAQLPGEVCAVPISITGLPYTTTDNTSAYVDDYSSTDKPPQAPGAVGNPSSGYLGGDDVVYAYTPSVSGSIDIAVTDHGTWAGVFVFTGCPFASTVGGFTSSSGTTPLTVDALPVLAGETYYIVISTFPSPQTTTYTLTVEAATFDCPILELNFGAACDDGNAGTVNDVVQPDCSCAGIPVAANDEACTATALACGDVVPQSMIGSTASITDNCNGTGAADVWFSFTSDGSQILTVGETSTFDAIVQLFVGDNCGSLVEAGACKDSPENYTVTVAGNYYFRVRPYSSINEDKNISVSLTCADYDCPLIPANFGSTCDDGNAGTYGDVVDADCNCTGTPYDCTAYNANFGDPCDLGNGEIGELDANCDCAEVTCQNTSKYPSAAVTPNSTGASTQISSCNYWSEYSEIAGVISGFEYEFNSTKAGATVFVTVREGSVGGPVVGSGPGPLTITANSNANLFVHWNADAICGTSSGCAVSTVSCVTCASAVDCEGVPGGPAQPGTACDDGDPGTYNDVYDASCNCAGMLPTPGSVCESALPVDCNAEPATYSSVGSIATNTTTCSMGSKGLWFSFMGTGAQIIVNSTATFDHRMSVNTGSCGSLTNLICKDGSTGAETYTIATSVANQMYYVYIAHYSSSNSTTGDIGISLVCATPPACEAPSLALAVQDEAGVAIEGCLTFGSSYYVLATLSGGSGNTSYNVIANGSAPIEVAADGSQVFGPFTVGTNVNVSAVGIQDGDCSASATATSPAVCPPANDNCDGAIALACNAEPATYSSVGSLAVAPAGCTIGKNGIWFSFVGTGADITINSTASFDHKMSMQTGSCTELTWIACKDGSVGAETYTVASSVLDQMYYVYVAHYSSTSTTTGNITMSLNCAIPPACEATLLALSAQDENGVAIAGCLPFGSSYYVSATLSGGDGNDTYNVTANSGTSVEVSADASTVFGPFTVGTNVTVVAVGAQDTDCSTTAVLTSPAVCPPANDDCVNAIGLVCGEVITGSTANATASGLSATCGTFTSSSALDVFYSFEADGTSDYTVSLDAAAGNTFDGILFVYSGACGALTSLGCSDDGNPEEMELLAPAAGTYIVRLFRYTTSGSFTLGLECTPNVVYDCPLLEANINDPCDDGDATTENDMINADCECVGTPIVVYDCPDLEANINDPCDDGDASTENDLVNADCECVGTPIVVYDCPDLEANINDPCDDGDASTENDVVNSDCECVGTPIVVYDCPDLEANINDPCDDGDAATENDLVNADCECVGTPIVVYDCPDLEANIGSSCDDGDAATENDMITEDCLCAGTPISVPCTNTNSYGVANVSTPGTKSISTCQWFREYATISGVNDGYEYEFAGAENTSGNLAYITVHSGTFDGPVVAAGWSPLSVTASSSDNLFVHFNSDENCGTTTNCATTTATCITCATIEDCAGVPGGSALPGTPCDDGDATTYDDTYTADCNCEGTQYDCVDLLANIGSACDDGDPATVNDLVGEDCVCAGEPAAVGSVCDSAIPVDCNAEPATYSSAASNGSNTTSCMMGNNGLWFSFMGTGADITVNSSASFDHEMSINSGSCDALVGLGCDDQSVGAESFTISPSVDGEMYYVYIARYNSESTTTGDITIDIDCGVVPECTAPELALSAVDAEGNPIEGCIAAGSDYYVLATLSGGFGNSSYNVSLNDADAVEVPADDSMVFGPYSAGTSINASALGVQDEDCGAYATLSSPALCGPDNDNCDGAIALECDVPVSGSTLAATNSGLGSPSCSGGSQNDVFYTLDVVAGDDYTITLNGADYDGVLVLYSGLCDALTEVACSDEGTSAGAQESITYTATADETITIRTYDWSSSRGSFSINVTCGTIEPPVGSSCDDAIAVDCNADPVTYSSVGANGTNSTECFMGDNGLWFSFMGTGADITVNSSASFDHEMSINSGSCDALVKVGCDDQSVGAESFTISPSVDGEMYYVYIARYNSESTTTGDITIDIDCGVVPECTAPELALSAVDAEGNPIEGCIASGSDYYVLATLSGGSGNSSYNVSLNDADAVEVPADDSMVFGPYSAGTSINASALGVQDEDCGAYATLSSPALCGPANDNCDGAIALECDVPVSGSTLAATNSGLGSPSCSGGSQNDVFYTLDVVAGDDYTITLNGADYDGVLVLYSGLCDALTEVACSDEGTSAGAQESITYTATADETITIRTYDWSSSRGSFSINVTCGTIEPPVGSSCDDAIAVDCNADPVTYSSVGANGTNSTECFMGDNGLWFSFMGTGADITVNSSASFDHEMSINSGSCDALVKVGCDDQSVGAESFTISPSVDGEMYYVYIARYNSESTTTGDITIAIDCAVVPECTAPELALSAVDAEGNPIEGCIAAGSDYYVLATLSGGSGNSSYNVSLNDADAVEVPADDSMVFGPYIAGTSINGSALGVQDEDCGAYATLSSPAICGPDNDDCEDAIALSCGDSVEGTTVNAGNSGIGSPGCAGGSQQDVFYSLDVVEGIEYTISVNGADYDGVLVLYSGACGSLAELDCSDNGFSAGVAETIAFTALASETLTIRTYDWSTSGGSFTISVACATVYDCPALEANIGDACDDGDPNTENDVITADCECAGTIISEGCDDFVIYLADFTEGSGTSIYEVSISGVLANLTLVTQYPEEIHIAYNNADNLIYGVTKATNSYVTVNPHIADPVFSAPVSLGGNYGQFSGATFSSDGEFLIASQSTKMIYAVDLVTNAVTIYDANSPIQGGDIAASASGMIYLATHTIIGGLYETYPPNVSGDVFLSNVPKTVTGLAITANDQLMLSAKGAATIELRDLNGVLATSYKTMLNNVKFTLNYGDMASGCNTYVPPTPGDCNSFTTFVAQLNAQGHTDVYEVNFSGSDANLTLVVSVPYEAHIAYNADDDLIYLGSKSQSFFEVYEPSGSAFMDLVNLSIPLNNVTGSAYNPNDGLLYVADAGADKIYTVHPVTGAVSEFSNANVYGGDLAILEDGSLFLATQSGNALYEISNSASPQFVGGIPTKVTGMTRSNNSQGFMVSSYKNMVFTEISSVNGGVIASYNVLLNGVPFQLLYGDMASGCADQPEQASKAQAQAANALTVLTSQPNPTSGLSQVIFTTPKTVRALVEVYDMNGRNVATLFDQEAQGGSEYRLDFNGTALPNGVYIYRLTTEKETIIEKFMIAK